MRALNLALATASAAALAGPHPNGIDGAPYNLNGDVSPVHDPAIAYEKASSTFFLSGTDQGRVPPYISFKCSPDLVTFTDCGAVFEKLPPWIAAAGLKPSNVWAPDISWSETRQLWSVYYAVSSFGSRDSAIGLATSPTLANAVWTDEGPVLYSNNSMDWNAIDPDVFDSADGSATYMAFGSFWDGIQVVQLDQATGKLAAGAAVANIAKRNSSVGGAIEGSFVVYQQPYYYLFASFDKCCDGNASTYNVRVGRSPSPEGPYVDEGGVAMLDGGGTYLVGHRQDGWAAGGGQSVLRTNAAGDANAAMVYHAYDATRQGTPWLTVSAIDWSGGWPKVL